MTAHKRHALLQDTPPRKRADLVLGVIEQWFEKNPGLPPSHSEIGKRLGVTGQAVWYYIDLLVKAGRLARTRGVHRSLQLVKNRRKSA